MQFLRKHAFLSCFGALVAAHVLLVGSLRLYPFIDLPNHLAAATIYRYYGQPGVHFSSFYAVDVFLKPNVLHLLFCGSPILPSVELANKLFYCLYVALLPLSVYLLVKRFRGNHWLSLLSLLLLYHHSVTWGFSGQSMSTPLVLLLVYFALDPRGDRVWSKVATGATLLLLFFTHVQSTLFALLLLFLLLLHRHRRSLRLLLRDSIVTVPTLVLILAWRTSEEYGGPSILAYMLRYYQGQYWAEFPWRVILLYQDNSQLFPGRLGLFLGLFFSFMILVPVSFFLILRRKEFLRDLQSERIAAPYILVFASLICCLVLPSSITGRRVDLVWIALNIYQRMGVFFFLFLVVLGAVLAPIHLKTATVTAICVVCVIHFALWFDYLRDFQHENVHFTERAFPEDAPNGFLAGLIYDADYRGRIVYVHFPNYHVVWNRGVTVNDFIDNRFFAVTRRASEEELPRYNDWVAFGGHYDGQYRNAKHILVKGNIPESDLANMAGFRLAKSQGEWTLYQNVDRRVEREIQGNQP
jgi:hypothetical protein